uniref:Uncharacterized protein n=1 Tax=Emiliania huxleyi TaxID=2903 RepID=A0A7S3TFX7_EMIHU
MFTPFSAPPTPRERPLACEVARIDILHISKIDQIEHAFSARLFIQLILRGGQHDAALLEGFNEPAPEFSLRPSATWLLHQFHFPNALKLEFAERKMTKMGADDLHMILRVDGTFLQHFQLHDFPYDSQTLQVHLSSHCANEGVAPVRFKWSPFTVKLQRPTHFALKDVWELDKPVRLDLETLSPSPGRTYPVLKACVEVTRKPTYHLVNVVFPMACFVLMGCCQFAHEAPPPWHRYRCPGTATAALAPLPPPWHRCRCRRRRRRRVLPHSTRRLLVPDTAPTACEGGQRLRVRCLGNLGQSRAISGNLGSSRGR